MLAGQVDLAVHSLKDVPTALPAGLSLCAYLERADPRDALLSNSGKRLESLPAGARVGTTSLRRSLAGEGDAADLHVDDLRGNVDTRIRRLRERHYDAIILAMAGLVRLGRTDEVTQVLDPEVFVPAPGQGAIALECRRTTRTTRAPRPPSTTRPRRGPSPPSARCSPPSKADATCPSAPTPRRRRAASACARSWRGGRQRDPARRGHRRRSGSAGPPRRRRPPGPRRLAARQVVSGAARTGARAGDARIGRS
jgi:hypothetical protein